MPKVDYIVCSQVADVCLVNAPYIVPGSLTANCSRCGEPVLVSPSAGEIRHDNPDSQFLCLQCGLASMKKDGGEIAGITPAQRKEIEEYLNKSPL